MGGSGVPVLGALRRAADVDTPSRHLGLVPVAERRAEALDAVAAQAQRVREGCDLEALLALARTAPPLPDAAWSPPVSAAASRPVIAVAGGPAFTFSYAEHTELLAAAAARTWPSSTPCATRSSRPAPRAWSSAAASRRCTRRSCPPTSRCARRSPPWRPPEPR
ncbi:hypothetical protein GCM10020221_13980 [Streptomyces thioluteus]|uniref:Uncharacterized protein n=1 Tax=Streptomyces thioluteus TaxID=66431 RepID=A0ABP6J2W5_STRTU